jgi:hypothetical protein
MKRGAYDRSRCGKCKGLPVRATPCEHKASERGRGAANSASVASNFYGQFLSSTESRFFVPTAS